MGSEREGARGMEGGWRGVTVPGVLGAVRGLHWALGPAFDVAWAGGAGAGGRATASPDRYALAYG